MAMRQRMSGIAQDVDEDVHQADNAINDLSFIETTLAVWATVVTVMVVLIVALIFRRLRKGTWNNAQSSGMSDAESAISVGSSKDGDDCSVIDVDQLSVGLGSYGHCNEAYEHCAGSTEVSVPAYTEYSPNTKRRSLPAGLETELNEETVEALANLPDEGGASQEVQRTDMVGHQYRMAPYNAISINKKPPGSSVL